jgi:ribosomal protein S12 methylthiotransferase
VTASRGRLSLVVLGCAKNQVEAESMSSRLSRLGWETTADIPNASVVVVHTCGFLEAARQEALETVAAMRKAAPRSFLVMSGCFSQYLNGKKPAGVDAVIGTGEFGLLPQLISGVSGDVKPPTHHSSPITHHSSPSGYHDASLPRPLRPGQLSAYLRVSEGCNHRCTFCVIPQLRGDQKSRPPEDILAEGRNLVDRGVRELTLISQDTSDYGRDLKGGSAQARPLDPGRRWNLPRLLREILAWPDLPWLRLLYVYPSEVGDELIDLLSSEERLLGYLDMPLQHISDRVLKAMARDWGRRPTMALLEKLKKRVKPLSLRTTFIVGFPGETEKEFREVETLVSDGWFEHAGVFPYSLEQRSPSARLEDRVPPPVVKERWDRLLAAQARVMESRSRVGREIEVLVETDPRGRLTARARHQAPEVDGEVRLSTAPARPGFYRVRVTGRDGVDLTADPVDAPGARRPSGAAGRPGARRHVLRSAVPASGKGSKTL